VGTLAYKRVTSDSQPTRVEQLLNSISSLSFNSEQVLMMLTVAALVTLVGRTLLQAGLNFKLVDFYSRLEAQIALSVFRRAIYSENFDFNQNKYSEYQYALTIASNRFVVGILSSFVAIFTDLFSTILMGTLAFVVSPIAFLASVAIFGLVFLVVNGPIHRRADFLGRETARVTENLNEKLLEIFRGIKEIKIYQKETEIQAMFTIEKRKQSLFAQQTQWLNTLSRYLLEIAMIFVAVAVIATVTIFNDARHAVTIMVLFMAVAYRLIPGLQRLQNSTISLRNAKGVTEKLFLMLDSNEPSSERNKREFVRLEEPFSMICSNLAYRYPESPMANLQDIIFEIEMGEILAIVGQSGAGKTTLLDLIGGLNPPNNGGIYFSTRRKSDERGDVRPRIGYVSQNSILFGADIYEAVSFNPKSNSNEKELIEATLVALNLKHLIPSRGNKISINVDGSNISGGERQRIAFARAIIGDSQLYILDEPTSSLDSKNKEIVIGLVKEIAKRSIVVFVTHDKDLLRIANKVLQMDNGKVKYFGSAKDYV
jgi:ABC-type bacteriocin/lantibiotic exporter with double-glycine peptidase domain